MADARERLRSCVTLGDVDWAVKHIDTQAARIVELEAALGRIVGITLTDRAAQAHEIARRVLEGKP